MIELLAINTRLTSKPVYASRVTMLSPPIFSKTSTPDTTPAIMKIQPNFLIVVSTPDAFSSTFPVSRMAIDTRKIITAIQKWFASRLNLLTVIYSRSPGESAAISHKIIPVTRIAQAYSFAF